jgi:hypothetical protein
MVPHMQQRVEALCRHPNDDGFACFSHKSQNEFVLTTPSRCLKSLKPLPGKKHHFPICLLSWHRARLGFLSAFLIALLRVKTVSLAELATAFSGKIRTNSHYKSLQRFFRQF